MTTNYEEMIIVSDWERVEKDDFYLTDKWVKSEGVERVEEARRLQEQNNLYIAYIIPAVHYAVYTQMDASQVFINGDKDVILSCESAVIGNKHDFRMAYPD